MRFLADPKMGPGRVIVKQGGEVVAVATSVAMLPVISAALQDGDETYACRETLSHVGLWFYGEERLRRMAEAERKRRQRARRAAK